MLAYQRLFLCALLVTLGMLDPAAGAPLNPRVRLLSRPSSKPPAECDEGLAPATTNQIEPAVAPQSALEPPPRSDLRSRLAEAQASAERGLRPEFIDAVEQLKTMLTSYPAGAERDAANAVVHVYDDTLRLWTYEFDNPAGGFFDASTEEGAILHMLSAYPEFGRFIAPQTLSAGGITIYPTREARGFLVAEAARRMRRIAGVPVTSPDQAPRAAAPETSPRSESRAGMPRVSGTPAPPSSASPGPAKRSSAASSPQHRKSSSAAASGASGSTGKKKGGGGGRVHVAHPKKKNKEESTASMAAASKSSDHRPAANASPGASTPASKARSEKPAQSSSSKVKRVAPDPSTPSYPAPAPHSPPAALSSGSQATSTSAVSAKGSSPSSSLATAAPVPTPSAENSTNGVTTSAAPASGTSTDPAAMTSSSTGSDRNPPGSETVGAGDPDAPAKPAPEQRSMIVPIVLILVGLGVLILLFRASN